MPKFKSMNKEYYSVALLLNGDPPSDLSVLKRFSYLACADGAYNHIRGIIKPDVIIGDMDSIGDLPDDIECIKYPKDKDYTDGELALKHLINLNPNDIRIFGARGGKRADLEYYNYFLLTHGIDSLVQITMDLDNHQGVVLLTKDNGMILQNPRANKENPRLDGEGMKGEIISLSPFMGDVHIEYSRGLKYSLNDTILKIGGIAPVSNVAIADQVEITIKSGMALLFYNMSNR